MELCSQCGFFELCSAPWNSPISRSHDFFGYRASDVARAPFGRTKFNMAAMAVVLTFSV